MAPLSAASARALARLRAYRAPPTIYHKLPLSRRAAVLLLLYADPHGDLKVVLTLRSSTLSTHAGQVSLPGGKADDLTESPVETARREAEEEIGLPRSDKRVPPPFRVEHLCELPTHLSLTELGVRPCVAFLHAGDESSSAQAGAEVERTLIPRLNAGEVTAIFAAPFQKFLSDGREDEDEAPDSGVLSAKPLSRSSSSASSVPSEYTGLTGPEAPEKKRKWYRGRWSAWHEKSWRMHSFYVPRSSLLDSRNQSPASSPTQVHSEQESTSETTPASRATASNPEDEDDGLYFRVFGLTAHIVVEAARKAYDQEPNFPYVSRDGDEEIIGAMYDLGKMSKEREKGAALTREDIAKLKRGRM